MTGVRNAKETGKVLFAMLIHCAESWHLFDVAACRYMRQARHVFAN